MIYDEKIEVASCSEKESIINLLEQNTDINPEDALVSIQKSNVAVICKAGSGEMIGCGTFRLWGEHLQKADIYVYVAPAARNAGIGQKLLESLLHVPECRKLKFFSTKVETNHTQSLKFYQRFGFEPWYTEVILCHCGAMPAESNLKFEPYKSAYFERYVAALRDSFYELRKSNDFEPYLCCEANEEKRLELENNKENIFVLMDGETLAASIIVKRNFIEDVFVAPEYQGKGIGRELLRFAVNKAASEGYREISLSAIKWNTKALKLYESFGFQTVKTMHYLRLYNNI